LISIGEWAFAGCSSLESITVGDGNPVYRSANNCLIQISDNTLILGCNYSVIPNSVSRIGDTAFAGCSLITNLIIPSSVISIGNWAFTGCSGLENITVEDDNPVYRSENECLIRISDNTLILGCKNSIIPGQVTGIGHFAFDGCCDLTNITIPNSVTWIGYEAFACCESLENITLPISLISIDGYAFFDCSSLKNITIPKSLTWIGASAFYGCRSLTSFTIPYSVYYIGSYAFDKHLDFTIYAEIANFPTGWWNINWNPYEVPVVWDCSTEKATPRDLEATAGIDSIELNWSSPIGITLELLVVYNVYRDGTYIASTTQTSYIDNDVVAGTEYNYHTTALFIHFESEASNSVIIAPTTSDYDIVAVLTTELKGNYPNPFNPTTTIQFSIHCNQWVEINVFNIKGQKVKTLVNEYCDRGTHNAVWNGNDEYGRNVSSGMYFYKMQAGEYNEVKKMLLMK
jgi:hypothetical protein